MTSAQATGHIRLYHAVVGGILLLNVPVSYLFLLYGQPPVTVLVIGIGLAIVALIARLCIISPLIGLPVSSFLSSVVARVSLVSIIAGGSAFVIQMGIGDSLLATLGNLAVAVLISIFTVWLFGLDKLEKQQLANLLKSLKARSSEL